MNTSQPSISKALRRLEEIVGCRLFEPQGRSIYPTSKAQLLLEPALRVEHKLEETGHRAAEIRRGRHQGVRIAAALLPRTVIAFRAVYPDMTLEIEL